jgi:hypothetical protein
MLTMLHEWANQVVFLTSILAGFALAVVVQLIMASDRRRVADWAMGAFILSTALLLAATTIGSIMLMRWEVWQQATLPATALARIYRTRGLVNGLMLGGLAFFLGGLGLAGWIHSKVMGILADVAVTLTALLLMWALRVLP